MALRVTGIVKRHCPIVLLNFEVIVGNLFDSGEIIGGHRLHFIHKEQLSNVINSNQMESILGHLLVGVNNDDFPFGSEDLLKVKILLIPIDGNPLNGPIVILNQHLDGGQLLGLTHYLTFEETI